MGYDVTFHLIDTRAVTTELIPALLDSDDPPEGEFAGVDDPADFWSRAREVIFEGEPERAAHAACEVALRWSAARLPWVWTRNLAATYHPIRMEDELKGLPDSGFRSAEGELFLDLVERRPALKGAFPSYLTGNGRTGGLAPSWTDWGHNVKDFYASLDEAHRRRALPILALARAAQRRGYAVWEASDLVDVQGPRPELLHWPGLDRFGLEGGPLSEAEWDAIIPNLPGSTVDLVDLFDRLPELDPTDPDDAQRVRAVIEALQDVVWYRLPRQPTLDAVLPWYQSVLPHIPEAWVPFLAINRDHDQDLKLPDPLVLEALTDPDLPAPALSVVLDAATRGGGYSEERLRTLVDGWLRLKLHELDHPEEVSQLPCPSSIVEERLHHHDKRVPAVMTPAILQSGEPERFMTELEYLCYDVRSSDLTPILPHVRAAIPRLQEAGASFRLIQPLLYALPLEERMERWLEAVEQDAPMADDVFEMLIGQLDEVGLILLRRGPDRDTIQTLADVSVDFEEFGSMFRKHDVGELILPFIAFGRDSGDPTLQAWAREMLRALNPGDLDVEDLRQAMQEGDPEVIDAVVRAIDPGDLDAEHLRQAVEGGDPGVIGSLLRVIEPTPEDAELLAQAAARCWRHALQLGYEGRDWHDISRAISKAGGATALVDAFIALLDDPEVTGATHFHKAAFAMSYLTSADPREVTRVVEATLPHVPRPHRPDMLYNAACAHAQLGDAEAAAETLARAIAIDPRQREDARGDSDFAQVRDDPAFKAVIDG